MKKMILIAAGVRVKLVRGFRRILAGLVLCFLPMVSCDSPVDSEGREPAAIERVTEVESSTPGATVLVQVRVSDQRGRAVEGAVVAWKVLAGDGEITDSSGSTDAAGIAQTHWKLGHAPGTNRLEARVDGCVTTEFAISVLAGEAAKIRVAPDSLVLIALGEQVTLEATVLDVYGNVLADRAITWSVADPTVANVDAAGVVHALSNGRTVITGVADSAHVTIPTEVRQRTARLAVSHDELNISVGDSIILNYQAWDPGGHLIEQPRIRPSISDYYIATVTFHSTPPTTEALLTGYGPGETSVVFESDGATDTMAVRVAAFEDLVLTQVSRNCGLTAGGAAYCWGSHPRWWYRGGGGATTLTPAPIAESLRFESIETGHGTICGIALDERTYCWGIAALGDGTDAPFRYEPDLVAGEHRFASVHAGVGHFCGLTREGAAYCWGSNTYGQLGDGTLLEKSAPVRSAAEHRYVQISAGGNQTCGLTSVGTIYCWGVNEDGQLGAVSDEQCFDVFAEYDCSTKALKVDTDIRFTDVVVSGSHACGLTATGMAYCWGATRRNVGELGSGVPEGSRQPVEVAGGLRFTSLTASPGFTCGLAEGAVYCWGSNNWGQLGSETSEFCSFFGARTPCASQPVPVIGGHSFDAISAGGRFTCGIVRTGGVYCWGGNNGNELGQTDGSIFMSAMPLRVYGTR